MKDKKTNNLKLMSELKSLYGKLSILMAKMRTRSYHSLVESSHSFDMTSVLNSQVDDYVNQHLKEKAANTHPPQHEIQSHNTAVQPVAQTGNDVSYTPQNTSESEFTKHLKQRKPSSVTQPHMGDSLKASTWEHIHAAIRFASQGDVDKAKLHTSIAGRALDEAGHFMSDSDYAELVYQIEHYFIDAKK